MIPLRQSMPRPTNGTHALWLLLLVAWVLLPGCSGLPQSQAEPVTSYLLEGPRLNQLPPNPEGPSLTVNPPGAAPGYDSPDMLYIETAHQLDHFARHRWIDTPAKMLQAAVITHTEVSGLFSRVLPARARMSSDLRLEIELVKLHQSFLQQPSQIELSIRLNLIANSDNRLVSSQLFSTQETTPEETPYGGVIAANRALSRGLEVINGFLERGIDIWRQRL